MRPHIFFILLVACGSPVGVSADIATTATSDWSVVGGTVESRFPAIGYLMTSVKGKALAGPNCGATLVAPNVAVTAAHCVWDNEITKFGMGFGKVYSGPAHPGQAFMHPDYRRNAAEHRYRHDFAVIVLDHAVNDVEPMGRAIASVDDEALYVGYGRTTEGDYDVSTGYTSARKSTKEQVTQIDATNIWTTGVGGGLCWGDSGGPMIDPDAGTVLGVLSDFDEDFYCKVGNKMLFSSLDGNAEFLDQVMACAQTTDVQGCLSAKCEYACSKYNYVTSECHGGWRCDGACLQYIGDCK